MSPSISLIQQPDYNQYGVYQAIRRAIDLLGGIERFVRPGERILLKPNLLSPAPPQRAITTHPAVVQATINLVREAGGEPFIGDSPGMATLAKVAEVAGIKKVAEQTGIELLDFDEAQEIRVPPDFRFKRIEVAKAALQADGIINLPKLKTHGQMTLTLSVKNMFGCIPGKRKAQWHFQAGVNRDLFAQMLVEIYLVMKPRLNILDGILGMEGDGPGNGGSPRWIHLLAASPDGPALDMAVADLLGIPLATVPTIQAAHRKEVGGYDLAKFQWLGEPPEGMRISDFLPPRSMDLGWGLPSPLRRLLRGALTARPEIDSQRCQLCQICLQACPSQAIQENRGQLRINQHRCIRCFCCQELCPEGAVKTQQGWGTRWLGIRK